MIRMLASLVSGENSRPGFCVLTVSYMSFPVCSHWEKECSLVSLPLPKGTQSHQTRVQMPLHWGLGLQQEFLGNKFSP